MCTDVFNISDTVKSSIWDTLYMIMHILKVCYSLPLYFHCVG